MGELELFEDDWGVDNNPVDNTEITTTILYFSKEELKLFKQLCKQGIKQEFGEEYQQKGNLSDFLLKTLNERYGSTTLEEALRPAASGAAQGHIFNGN